MSRKRDREPFVREVLPVFPAWGINRDRLRRAHLYIPHQRWRYVVSVCRTASDIPGQLMLAHADDKRYKKCLAWERKHKEE